MQLIYFHLRNPAGNQSASVVSETAGGHVLCQLIISLPTFGAGKTQKS